MARKSLVALLVAVWIGSLASAEKPLRMSVIEDQFDRTMQLPVFANSPKGNFLEDFEPAIFPPAGWSLAGSAALWSRFNGCSGYGSGSAAALADFYNISSGTQDMITTEFWPSVAGDSLIFDHAYAAYSSSYIDSLTIWTSTNGGGNWTKLIGLRGGPSGPLNTGGTTTNQFVPNSSQWATKRYALPVGTNKVLFRAHTAYGNELYLDNIQVTGQLADHDVLISAINAPQGQLIDPVTPQVEVKNNGSNTETFTATVRIDSAGVAVYQEDQSVTDLASGGTQTVDFPIWIPAIGNLYNIVAYTSLVGDQIPTNDTTRVDVNAYNQRRRVYVEDFTAQWCQYCPYVQNSLQQLRNEAGDSVIVAGLHPSTSQDSFYTTQSGTIMSFYGDIGGYPTTVWDGGDKIVGGWSAVYADHRAKFNERNAYKSPFDIILSGIQGGNTGTIHAEIYYPGGVPISGNLRMVITEESKYCVWPSPSANPHCDSMREFVRTILPSASGTPMTINNGVSTQDINFTLHSNWNKNRLWFIVYIQNMTTKEVYNVNEIKYSDLTGVEGEPPKALNTRVMLMPASPNPARGSVKISFSLTASAHVALEIFDISGKLVRSLTEGGRPEGIHTVAWDGRDNAGKPVANGIYFYRLTTGDYTATRKLTIIR